MLTFLITAAADVFLWLAIIREMSGRSPALRIPIIAVKAVTTALLLTLVTVTLTYRGEFAEPVNALRQIEAGAVVLLILFTAALSLLWLILRRLLLILRRLLSGPGKSRSVDTAAGKTGREKQPSATGMGVTMIFLLMALLMTDGYFRQRLAVRTIRQEITVNRLDPLLDGLKIAFISDLHLSSWYGNHRKLEQVMESITREKADLLINGGDFITYGWQEFGRSDTILRKAHARYGAFAVEGNHDDGTYHPGYDDRYGRECAIMLREKIESSGYTLLRDSAVVLPIRGSTVAIAGVTTRGHRLKMSYGKFNRVLSSIPDSIFTILLLHDPDGWPPDNITLSLPDLTLSGHTHGFQAGLPGALWSPSALFHQRWKGLYRLGESNLFVTTGTGTMGMAVRLFMPPEVVIITIRKTKNLVL